jgi:hypothetical protein
MSEIYPSVRLAIRDSVTRILFDRPGKWLTTAELLHHCEEAETSDTLAKILSDMAKTGRLMRGLKTLNSQGREVNTWGLAPKLRDKIKAGQLLAQSQELLAKSQDASQDAPAISALGDLPPPRTPEPPRPASAINEYQSLQPPFAWLLDEPDVPETPAQKVPEPPRPAFPLWCDASAAAAAALPSVSGATSKTPQPIQADATDIHYHPLPERWLPEMRLRLLGYDGGADPEIILRIVTEGHGAYLTLSTHGKIPFDPGELDFLPSVGNALCQFLDAIYPYGVNPGAK